jgi:hypothetical protein
MSNLAARQAARRARHYANDPELLAEYRAHHDEVGRANRERDKANIERGLALPPAKFDDWFAEQNGTAPEQDSDAGT